jgi:hypothetical protein
MVGLSHVVGSFILLIIMNMKHARMFVLCKRLRYNNMIIIVAWHFKETTCKMYKNKNDNAQYNKKKRNQAPSAAC